MDLDGHTRLLLENNFGLVGDALPSPDGKHIAFLKVVTESNVTLLENFWLRHDGLRQGETPEVLVSQRKRGSSDDTGASKIDALLYCSGIPCREFAAPKCVPSMDLRKGSATLRNKDLEGGLNPVNSLNIGFRFHCHSP
jgi:hypothetical protein